ncbi:MAG TPA: alkaline phosphatase family protein [Polyangia bacterium]
MHIKLPLILSSIALASAAACGCDGASVPAPVAAQAEAQTQHHRRGDLDVRHVLLLSIDGMHEIDLARFIAAHPRSALATLARHGVQYTNAWVNRLDGSATNPSDSFPGLLALTTGGSSRTHGGWYDVSYARDLYAPASGCQGARGTAVAYDESVELDNSHLWGSATDDVPTHDSSVARSRIDTSLLPEALHHRDCAPVYPHQFVRVNTIFEVARAFGLHTAWSDKHLAYELVNGPSGAGVDDFFAPEINSDPSKSLIPSASPGSSFTDLWTYTEVYDDYKVRAILNQIDGKWSDDGLAGATDTAGTAPGTPAIFGMNFQAVSVAQKDASPNGGYADAAGTPGPEVADALLHTDESVGKMVAALRARGLLDSTLVIVTAKHGQSPIDKALHRAVDGDAVAALVDSAAPLAGHIEDDVALYWLQHAADAPAAVRALASPTATLDPRAATIFTTADPRFVAMFGDPTRDPHVPDVVVALQKGTIYSLSKSKDAEHGGFADDDAHVGLLMSNPQLPAATNDAPVRTKQVAPTILDVLDIDPRWLDAVRREGTEVLPSLDD